MKENKWIELGIKEKLAISTAVVAFLLGWTLTAIAAFVPLFLTEHSILIVLAQGMTYAAAVFGVSSYFNAESVRMRRDLQRMMIDERKKLNNSNDEEDTE